MLTVGFIDGAANRTGTVHEILSRYRTVRVDYTRRLSRCAVIYVTQCITLAGFSSAVYAPSRGRYRYAGCP